MTTDEVLRCEDCGREFFRPSAKGMPPRRCPDCKLEARKAAARRSNAKKMDRRHKVVAKALKKREEKTRYCVVCGIEIPAIGRKKYCSQCAYKAGRQAHAAWQRKERAEGPTMRDIMQELAERRREAKQRHAEARRAAKAFDKLIAAADKAGMTYGQYQAMLRRQRMKQGGEG